MTQKHWLISWIGETDHLASEGQLKNNGIGPIATALQGEKRFDRVYLLTNYPHARSLKYCSWAQDKCGYKDSEFDLYQIELDSPTGYDEIYTKVCKHLKEAGLPNASVELTFHLSPGTPAMAVIWTVLARTRFPAKLIQTSQQRGLESVEFSVDLANHFLPEFLRRSDERIGRLTEGPNDVGSHFSKILHNSEAMRRPLSLAQRIAVHNVPVLILGETGTGKELFAEAIHLASGRKGKEPVTVNCGAILPELANSELFGHKKGSFTGAMAERKGHFEEADGGTLFLDEIGDLPLDTQVRLLRVLQSKEVTPLGSSKPIKVDVRVIAATHRDLSADVASGRFREDLFHRLAVGILQLPPLRERGGDIDLLIDAFVNQVNSESKGKPEAQEKKLSISARKILLAHSWPGNVRELYHTLLRASIWSQASTIEPEDISLALLKIQRNSEDILGRPLTEGFDLQGLLDNVSRDYVKRAIKQTGNRKSAAANLLGFRHHQTLSNWMDRLGLDKDVGTT